MTTPCYDPNNPKLDVYIDLVYAYSTNWYESIDHYLEVNETADDPDIEVIEA